MAGKHAAPAGRDTGHKKRKSRRATPCKQRIAGRFYDVRGRGLLVAEHDKFFDTGDGPLLSIAAAASREALSGNGDACRPVDDLFTRIPSKGHRQIRPRRPIFYVLQSVGTVEGIVGNGYPEPLRSHPA